MAFLSQGITDETRKRELSDPSKYLKEDEEFIQEGNSIYIFSRRPVISKEQDDDKETWKEISIMDIHETLNKINSWSKSRSRELDSKMTNHSYIGSFSVLICGSKKNYWLESQVDLSDIIGNAEARETFFSGMSSNLKLDILNQGIFGSDDISGNTINSLPFEANLYAFRGEGGAGSKSISSIPTHLLLDFDVEEEEDDTENDMNSTSFSPGQFMTHSEGETRDESKTSSRDKKDIHFKTHIKNIIRTISSFMGSHMAFQSVFRENFNQYKKKAAKIRKSIQGLQSDINGILLGDDEKKKIKKGTGRSTLPTEDDIIYSSSVYSSSLTEIDENVSNLILFLTERRGNIERMEIEAKLDNPKEVPSLGDTIEKFTEQLKVWRENILNSFDKLRRNLTNSQNRLRNTIDVFSTYRESKRRRGQKKMANTLNFIFSALAIVELSDFLGGLVTYGLTHNDWAGAGIMFLQAFSFLLVIALFIYIFVLRNIWKEK